MPNDARRSSGVKKKATVNARPARGPLKSMRVSQGFRDYVKSAGADKDYVASLDDSRFGLSL